MWTDAARIMLFWVQRGAKPAVLGVHPLYLEVMGRSPTAPAR